jgi:hypothetical protein
VDTAWKITGSLLDALTRRDFAGLAACLTPDVRLRALVLVGPFERSTPEEVSAQFERWFGGPDEFELADATAGQVGARVALRWRVRMWPAGDPASARVAEQHVYATGTDRIASLDLLCSGFHLEHAGSLLCPTR